MIDNRPPQELTSTYFNSIIKKAVSPVTVDDLDPALVSRFEDAVAQGFPEDFEQTKERIHYLIPYILNSIDWDAYRLPLEGWQLKYYYKRDRFLEVTGLDYEKFLEHSALMDSLEQLSLAPAPTFEFILFLKYYYTLRSDLRHSPNEILASLKQALKTATDDEIMMDVKVGKRHFKFENVEFIKRLFETVNDQALNLVRFNDSFSEGVYRDKVRALDYYMIKTLLDYLPIKVEKRRGKFTQAERNFSLSVLNFVGRLAGDDIEGICSQENNVTFDKLMRDFRDSPIPYAMELFL